MFYFGIGLVYLVRIDTIWIPSYRLSGNRPEIPHPLEFLVIRANSLFPTCQPIFFAQEKTSPCLNDWFDLVILGLSLIPSLLLRSDSCSRFLSFCLGGGGEGREVLPVLFSLNNVGSWISNWYVKAAGARCPAIDFMGGAGCRGRVFSSVDAMGSMFHRKALAFRPSAKSRLASRTIEIEPGHRARSGRLIRRHAGRNDDNSYSLSKRFIASRQPLKRHHLKNASEIRRRIYKFDHIHFKLK